MFQHAFFSCTAVRVSDSILFEDAPAHTDVGEKGVYMIPGDLTLHKTASQSASCSLCGHHHRPALWSMVERAHSPRIRPSPRQMIGRGISWGRDLPARAACRRFRVSVTHSRKQAEKIPTAENGAMTHVSHKAQVSQVKHKTAARRERPDSRAGKFSQNSVSEPH